MMPEAVSRTCERVERVGRSARWVSGWRYVCAGGDRLLPVLPALAHGWSRPTGGRVTVISAGSTYRLPPRRLAV